MKILKSGTKIRDIKFYCDKQLIEIIYEKGLSVEYITLTFELASEINFINFENLNKIIK